MASGTAYYNLRKDASTDNYDVAVVNQNLDDIDAQMHQNEVASTTPFVGADSSTNGEKGIVPRPMAGDENKVLYGDGTWKPVQGGGGGSSVIPNPTGTPTDTLDTVSIDGTIYEIQGSGSGGSGYTETVLNSGTHSDDVYTLSDNISNYDMLEIEWIYNSSYYGTSITSVESFKTNATGILVDNTDNILFVIQYTSETTMTRTQKYGSLEIRQIKGLKFGGGGSSSHAYSTTEHKIGTWVDGSDLYERTINITTGSFTATQDMDISNYIDNTEVVHESIGVFNYTYQGVNYSTPINGRETEIVYWNGVYKLRLNFGSGSLDGMDAYITIRYTKTGGNS